MHKLIFIICVLLVYGCSPKKQEKDIIIVEKEGIVENISYEEFGKLKLSEYGFFLDPLSELHPSSNVFPYELNSPLFTDYAFKKRFISIPDGAFANYHEKEVLEFPVGTVLIKNFYYEDSQLANNNGKIIETRLLIHEEEGWNALPYIWNEEQTDAFLEITGGEQNITLLGKEPFSYSVPNMAQCKSCHEINGSVAPIGPTSRQLNKIVHGKNQLFALAEAGVLHGLPTINSIKKLAVWDDDSENIDDRARAYLEINCGHCHRPEGPGKNSGLDLTIFSVSDLSLGIYKGPVAAGAGSGGLNYDIVPGSPEESILTYRMESIDPGVMMPELGRKLVHTEGIELIKDWIKTMK